MQEYKKRDALVEQMEINQGARWQQSKGGIQEFHCGDNWQHKIYRGTAMCWRNGPRYHNHFISIIHRGKLEMDKAQADPTPRMARKVRGCTKRN